MEPIPMEWVEKLFECMKLFYEDRWISSTGHDLEMKKKIWQNGLHGLTYDQIKFQLKRYKIHAQHPFNKPPLVTEFYQCAKTGFSNPEVIVNHEKRGDPNVAKDHLRQIKQKLSIN